MQRLLLACCIVFFQDFLWLAAVGLLGYMDLGLMGEHQCLNCNVGRLPQCWGVPIEDVG